MLKTLRRIEFFTKETPNPRGKGRGGESWKIKEKD